AALIAQVSEGASEVERGALADLAGAMGLDASEVDRATDAALRALEA
ncbi:MAG: hypothetical protein FJ104_09855, partial [Deltaproteobacteria bacterium]|nr:hypothetical protein [Deltaproteobacteria bacterium]